MLTTIKKQTEEHMQKSLAVLKDEFSKIRTSRAHPSLLEQVMVACYGMNMPLNQMATVNVADAQTLTVSPWDKGALVHISKAILKADLGLNPVTTGELIRIPMPPLSQERREEFVKLVKKEAEQARVAIRNIRRDANNEIKKNPQFNEDEAHDIHDIVQKLTDKHIKLVDETLADKEKDLRAV